MTPIDPLDAVFEGRENTPAQETKIEAEPAQQPEADGARLRDEHGRFAPSAKPAEAAPVVEPPKVETQPPAPQKPQVPEGYLPIGAILDEREKRQKLEAELKTLRERVEQQTAKPIPNFSEDPEGYAAHLRSENERTAIGVRFDMSELSAREKHGDELVQKAMDWGMERSNASQAFAAEYVRERHPIDWIVRQFKRDQFVSSVGDDPDEYVRKRYAELTAASPQPSGAAPPQPAATPAKPAPTPSLASAPSAGKGGPNAIPIGAGAAFDAVIPR